MEKNIVLIHSGIAVLMLLYLFIRILVGLFGLKDPEYQKKIRGKFRRTDWAFTVLLALSGAYPLILPGQFELYHLLKILLLAAFIGLARYGKRFHFTGGAVVSVAFLVMAGYMSFTDQPLFPKKQSSFEAEHPEMRALSRIDQGKLIFTTICSNCHGDNGKLGRFGAADLTASRLSKTEKLKIVTEGSPLTVMRSFRAELSASEIEAVVAYVHGLTQ